VPVQLQQAIFHAGSKEAGDYAMQAMMKMKKIVIEDLHKK
jgi:predicted 3-demethylubiquinone-9 3-methyltransferase (glyoxalase superfamily)